MPTIAATPVVGPSPPPLPRIAVPERVPAHTAFAAPFALPRAAPHGLQHALCRERPVPPRRPRALRCAAAPTASADGPPPRDDARLPLALADAAAAERDRFARSAASRANVAFDDDRFAPRSTAEAEPCLLVGVELTTRQPADASLQSRPQQQQQQPPEPPQQQYSETSQSSERIFSLSASLAELDALARTAGLTVVGTLTQSLPAPDPSTYIRSGKVAELRAMAHSAAACTVIFDVELSPPQQRALEAALAPTPEAPDAVKVIDRTALILDIFAQHALSRDGQLQVELALYEYRLPRLTRLWTHLERQSGSGGVGLRGPGETQLEVDRRLIRSRVAKLRRQLARVRHHRARLRAARKRRARAPVVALVGYTNAGKTTLLNALTGASALAADALFATLDPTTRRANLPGFKLAPEVLVTDTVGFVQHLPTMLVAAFRATLEEVVEADLLVHVVDGAADGRTREWQMRAVDKVIGELGAGDKPTVYVLNKADLLGEQEALVVCDDMVRGFGCEAVPVSARTGLGLEEVGVAVEEALRETLVVAEVLVPYDRGDLTGRIYREGCVLAEEFGGDGTRLTARVPIDLWRRLREFFVEEEEHGGIFGDSLGEAAFWEDASDEDMWNDLAKGRHSPRRSDVDSSI